MNSADGGHNVVTITWLKSLHGVVSLVTLKWLILNSTLCRDPRGKDTGNTVRFGAASPSSLSSDADIILSCAKKLNIGCMYIVHDFYGNLDANVG